MIIRQDVKTWFQAIDQRDLKAATQIIEGVGLQASPSVSNFSTSIFWSQDAWKELFSRNTWGHKSQPWNQVVHDDLYGLWMALFYGLCH